HLETGSEANPYVGTVRRGMRRLFTSLVTSTIGPQTNGLATFNPDGNGNGVGGTVNQIYPFYQNGQIIDAIVTTSTPSAVVTTGPLAGRTYASVVQDMADYYAYCQYDANPGGAWRYSCNQYPDNSASQWGAIGIIPAERV